MSPRRGACLVDTLLRRLNLFKPKLRFLTLGVFQEGRADCSQTPLGRVDTCGIEDILSRTTSARMREASRGKSLPHHIFMYVYIYIQYIYKCFTLVTQSAGQYEYHWIAAKCNTLRCSGSVLKWSSGPLETLKTHRYPE